MGLPTRRQVVLACASGAAAALAGCSGDQSTPGGTDGGAPTDGSGDGPTATEDAGGGTDGSGSGTETTGGSETDSGAPELGDTVVFPDSFAMTATVSTGGQTFEMSGRFDGEDLYWEFEQGGQVIEWYLVGERSYVVTGGQCFSGSLQQGISREDVDPGTFAEGASANPAVEPVGTDTIDGEEVLVYEVSGSGAAGGETLTYYVLADSGYPRRIESESMQWDFHSWGEVEPVEAPEMDCRTMPGSTPAQSGR